MTLLWKASTSRLFVTAMGLNSIFFLANPVLAWNAEGHMVVAQIAYNHLDPEVKAKCDAVIAVNLGSFTSSSSSNFVTAAVWADDFKNALGTGTSHYIDLPISLDGYPTNTFPPGVPNVVTAINQYIAVLQDPSQPLTNQATALRYLLHYVGDIEQPLHCANGITTNNASSGGDAGGNGFSLGSGNGNLHSFWDGGGGYLNDSISRPLNSAGQTTLSNRAASVEAAYPYSLSVGTIPDSLDWAREGWAIARTNTYVGVTNGLPASASYSNRAQATTMQRMAIGGQRLAKLLSTIMVTNAPIVTSVNFTNANFGLSWSSVSGRIYRVQWKQQLSDAAWSNLVDVTASGTAASYNDANTESQRYYRVIAVN
jgi:hypothetical protein